MTPPRRKDSRERARHWNASEGGFPMTSIRATDAPRKVLMAPELMDKWTRSRTDDGYLLTWEWGEPDAEGFYTPAVTRHEDDRLVNLTAARERIAALDPQDCSDCHGDGWTAETTANPDEDGQPGEPYQYQRPCDHRAAVLRALDGEEAG